MFSQNAMNNLKNRYTAVLKKCHLLNTFGSLAVVGMLCVGAVGVVAPCGLLVQDAWAVDIGTDIGGGIDYELDEDESGTIKVYSSSGGGDLAYLTIVSNGGNYTYTSTAYGYIDKGSLTVGKGSGGEYTTTLNIKTGTLEVGTNVIIHKKGKLIVESGASLVYDDDDGDYTLTVSEGGLYAVNSAEHSGDAWVNDAINDENVNLNANNFAILAVGTPLTIASDKQMGIGNIGVGSDCNSGATAIGFGENSLLVVNAGALGDNYALTTTSGDSGGLGNIEVRSGAKLLISNVAFTGDQATVKIAKAAGSLSISEGAWGHPGTTSSSTPSSITGDITETAAQNNLYFANALIEAASYTYDFQNNTYTLTLTKEAADNKLPLMDKELAKLIDSATDLPDYINKGIDLEDTTEAASTIESAAKMSLGAGVLAALNAVTELGANSVANRTNLTEPADTGKKTITQIPVMLADSSTSFTDTPAPLIGDAATGNGLVNGFALWVQPLYQSVSADGFKSGNFEYGYDTDIFGVSLGADYTMDSKWRFGLAFHMGDGDTESNNSDLSYTKNDFDYYGATLYSGYVLSNLSLSADIGYMVTTNDVVQKSSVGVLSTGDFDAGAFSVGARAQYKVTTSFVDIVPYLGARLNYSHVDSFNTKDASGIVFHNESAEATTFGIPVGVTFAKTIEFEDFTLTPRAKVGVQFTMGDLDVEQRVSLPNVSGHATMESEVFDPVTFMSGVGLDLGFDNVNLALEYNLGASENVLSQQVMATFSYKF